MYDFNYVDVKRVNHHSSFVSLESGMEHFKNRIGLGDDMKGQNGMIDYKNHIGHDDIFTKRGGNGIIHYDF